MKFITQNHLLGLTALAVATIAITPTNAAIVANPANNDIFVGFRATGGTGASVNYLVNLGAYSAFANQAINTSVELTTRGNLGADLVATFGSNWNTRSDVLWGIFGTSTSGFKTTYGSRERTSPETPATAWSAQGFTERSATANAISSVLTNTGGFQGSTATSNNAFGTVKSNAAQASSYAFQVGTGASDFGTVSGWTSIEGDFGGGVSGTALDLFRFTGNGTSTGTVSNPGFFTISSGGLLSFNTGTISAVPEVSSMPVLGVVGAMLFLTNRRRQNSKK